MPKTYLTSDLHLDHERIIKYCNRPFKNLEDMNKTLINNWNNIISKNDTIFFLGDLALLKYNPYEYYINQLNGNKVLIKGNHDRTKNTVLIQNLLINYKQHTLFLTHNPKNKHKHFWTIHGHTHNNNPDKYPLINHKTKTINISTELTNYTPINLEEIIALITQTTPFK
jgi:calcineurin-like phosphoesterase family protein